MKKKQLNNIGKIDLNKWVSRNIDPIIKQDSLDLKEAAILNDYYLAPAFFSFLSSIGFIESTIEGKNFFIYHFIAPSINIRDDSFIAIDTLTGKIIFDYIKTNDIKAACGLLLAFYAIGALKDGN